MRASITYWRKGLASQNFGDYLSELLYFSLTSRARRTGVNQPPSHDFGQLFLVGSVISEWHIKTALAALGHDPNASIGFWGCDMRNDRMPTAALLARCCFMGVRGPLTRDRLGLPDNTPLGDTGLLTPLIYRPERSGSSEGKTLCMPHFLDQTSDEALLAKTGVDAVIRPQIRPLRNDLLAIIDAIAEAGFVLTGALHGAVIAAAYGVPFAFFDSGYVDAPLKWRDFAASLSIPTAFASDLAMGRRIYRKRIRNYLRLPKLEAILSAAPIPAPPNLIRRAQAFDERRRARQDANAATSAPPTNSTTTTTKSSTPNQGPA